MSLMRSHHRSSPRGISGGAWRALLLTLTLGLALPATAAGPGSPQPAAPCTPEAIFLGQGQRDFADASEIFGGDGAPDLVLTVRGCKLGIRQPPSSSNRSWPTGRGGGSLSSLGR